MRSVLLLSLKSQFDRKTLFGFDDARANVSMPASREKQAARKMVRQIAEGPAMDCGLIRHLEYLGDDFPIELCRKDEVRLGPVTVDHWWMQIAPIYSQRQQGSPPHANHQQLLRLYWSVVTGEGATSDREAQERFLLGSLVPHVRANGSRDIFADAFLRPPGHMQQQRQIRTLNRVLRADLQTRLTRADFEKRTRKTLRCVEIPAENQPIYDSLSSRLLDEPAHLLSQGMTEAASERVRQNWHELMRTIGRRAGQEGEKLALNKLSYEARAAIHHIYSVAWLGLIYLLEHEDGIDDTTSRFLKFWHLVDATEEQATSLFHGHVFALHPAMGPFILSPSGAELLGNWLADPDSVRKYECLLNGLWLATLDYAERRDQAVEDRPRSNEQLDPDPERLQEARRERQRRTHPPQ